MSKRLEGKVAIITGGGSGFGKAISTKYVNEGAKVVIADFSDEFGTKTSSELGCAFVKTNVTSRQDWENLLKKTIETYGQLDFVVNNAGTTYKNKPTETVTDEEYDKVMLVNVKSLYLCTSVLVPYFLENKRPGCVVTISSTAALRPRPQLAWYNASKAAVSNATRTLAIEYGARGIRFNCVNPSVASGTGLSASFIGKEDTPENFKAFVSTIPLGRSCGPADVANACAYICSDEGSYITGVDFPVSFLGGVVVRESVQLT